MAIDMGANVTRAVTIGPIERSQGVLSWRPGNVQVRRQLLPTSNPVGGASGTGRDDTDLVTPLEELSCHISTASTIVIKGCGERRA